jgi:hypothetical protein
VFLKGSNSFYEQINPGNTLRAWRCSTGPNAMTPAQIELHDSVFSGGVDVSLR